MLNLKQYRTRALRAIIRRVNSLPTDVCDWDKKLDDIARECLDLPFRPENDLPYLGWLGAPITEEDKPVKTSQQGINLIKRWEGFKQRAYICPGNVWTIGYGHTKNVKQGMCISQQQGEDLLREDLEYFETQVKKLVKVDITQLQFDALVSFAFNVGVGALAKSTLLRKLNQGKEDAEVANEFGRWVFAAGKKLSGLVSRRREEKELFLEGSSLLS